jgi:anti-sigma B factor antagonist
MPDEALAVHESDVDGVRLLEVFGELDLATAPRLCALLDAARVQRVRRLVVDLTGVDFCDSTGLRALVGASTELRHSGGKLAVAVLPNSALARLFEVAGIREGIPTYDTQREALASVLPRLPT